MTAIISKGAHDSANTSYMSKSHLSIDAFCLNVLFTFAIGVALDDSFAKMGFCFIGDEIFLAASTTGAKLLVVDV